MKQLSQAERTLLYLQTGKRLTSRSALMNLGIISFPKRICELRKQGHIIHQRRITVKGFNGVETAVQQYWLDESELASQNA